MQTCVYQEFAIFGQYADTRVKLDEKMRASLGVRNGDTVTPYSLYRLNPEYKYIDDYSPGLNDPMNIDRVSIEYPPWGTKKISNLTVTPKEYVIVKGTDVWGKDKDKYIGCIASFQFNYPKEVKPTTCYTVMPFRPIQADETMLEAWNGEEIPIIWGGLIHINSEHPL